MRSHCGQSLLRWAVPRRPRNGPRQKAGATAKPGDRRSSQPSIHFRRNRSTFNSRARGAEDNGKRLFFQKLFYLCCPRLYSAVLPSPKVISRMLISWATLLDASGARCWRVRVTAQLEGGLRCSCLGGDFIRGRSIRPDVFRWRYHVQFVRSPFVSRDFRAGLHLISGGTPI